MMVLAETPGTAICPRLHFLIVPTCYPTAFVGEYQYYHLVNSLLASYVRV